MVHTTRAIVLRIIRHGDDTVVLTALTEALGVRSFLLQTGKRKAWKGALIPLNRLEIVAKERTGRDLLHIQDLRVERPYLRAQQEPVRGTIVLFVQEVLYKVLREEVPDAAIYTFVQEALEALDTTNNTAEFPLLFLVLLAERLGFKPTSPGPGEHHFDLLEGEFVPGDRGRGHLMPPASSALLAALLERRSWDGPITTPPRARRELLDLLLLYYRLHIDGLGELRSPAVLHETLS